MNYFELLPSELKIIISDYCSFKDIINLNECNCLKSDLIWTYLYNRDISSVLPANISEQYINIITNYQQINNIDNVLIWSSQNNYEKIVIKCFYQDADKGYKRFKALRLAIDNNNIEIIKLFITKGFIIESINTSIVKWAACNGLYFVIREMVNSCNINDISDTNAASVIKFYQDIKSIFTKLQIDINLLDVDDL